jgi:hypothetical protein
VPISSSKPTQFPIFRSCCKSHYSILLKKDPIAGAICPAPSLIEYLSSSGFKERKSHHATQKSSDKLVSSMPIISPFLHWRKLLISLRRLMGSETVSVFVGKKRKEFNVHKKLICEASKFFKDAFTGPYKEGQENRMHMPEDDPEVFSCFIDWLYRNPLPIIEDTSEVPKKDVEIMNASGYRAFGPPTKEEHLQEVDRVKKEVEEQKRARDIRLGDQFSRLLKLYFFAEKIFIHELMNRTIDRIRHGLTVYDRYLGNREVKLIYLNTSQGSMLRSFCAELLVYQLGHVPDKKLNQLASLMQEVPELIKDVLVECKALSLFKSDIICDWEEPGCDPDPRSRGDDIDGDLCCFHKHDSSDGDKPCYAHGLDELRGLCPMCGYGPHGLGCHCHF